MEIDLCNINKFFFIVIDLRSNERYQKYHIDGSINVSYNYLLVNPEDYLKKEKKYLLICDYGLMSKKISEILNKSGYHTFSLRGGIKKYQRFYHVNKKK